MENQISEFKTDGSYTIKIGKNEFCIHGKYYVYRGGYDHWNLIFRRFAKKIHNIVTSCCDYAYVVLDQRQAESCHQTCIKVFSDTGVGKNLLPKISMQISQQILNGRPPYVEIDEVRKNITATGWDAISTGELSGLGDLTHDIHIEKKYFEYEEYLQSVKWIKKRNEALRKSDYECSNCGNQLNLQVHHLNYNTLGNESQSDLLVLCSFCHSQIHKNKLR